VQQLNPTLKIDASFLTQITQLFLKGAHLEIGAVNENGYRATSRVKWISLDEASFLLQQRFSHYVGNSR
jgi:hypothetical protein